MTPTTNPTQAAGTLPIDTWPPIPGNSPYSINQLDIYPNVPANSTGIPDITKPPKSWTRSLQTGENPTDFLTYGYYSIVNGQIEYLEYGLTKGEAAASNPIPSNLLPEYNSWSQENVVPVPARPLYINESAYIAIPGGGINSVDVSNTNQTQTSALPVNSIDSRILTGINALLAHAGLSAV